MTAFRGPLVSEYYARELLAREFAGEVGEERRSTASAELRRWWRGQGRMLGPVSTSRSVFDLAAVPLASLLGFEPSAPQPIGPGWLLATLARPAGRGPLPLLLLVTGWAHDLASAWRDAVRHSLAAGADWCLCVNGLQLRLVDTRRSFSRRFLEFDIEAAIDDPPSFALFWASLRREAFEGGDGQAAQAPLIERIVRASAARTLSVCRSLRSGVLEAVGELVERLLPGKATGNGQLVALHEQALTLVYRLLFLLFAESRGLVPTWHPTYRRSYSMEAACALAEQEGPPRGLWETLQAISRLAHAGCHAGTLRVTPFNGRLFAPSLTPAGEHGRPGDECARRVLLSLTTAPGRGGAARSRIAYADLGVDQLGSIYESVLDYRAVLTNQDSGVGSRRSGRHRGSRIGDNESDGVRRRVALVAGSGLRKATGTFYTPSPITSFIVRRALAPLVYEAAPERILSLRILDPAMGSGAFLVSACRYLARAYEEALLGAGGCHRSDIGDDDRREFRRLVAQRCLYGVDLNPMAVQLARLSLWLATLAPERPLTFLDHRLLAGDSLLGASLDDIARRPSPGPRARASGAAPSGSLPLFDGSDAAGALRAVLPCRLQVATTPDENAGTVREKERVLASISGAASPLGRWKAVADTWCALALAERGNGQVAGLFTSLADSILSGRSVLPQSTVQEWLARVSAAAARRRFLHWSLEFPEVFFDSDGARRADAGFDAVLGNPPWDMIRADNEGQDEAAARDEACALLRFARGSGIYRALSAGQHNRYQLFVERAVRLARAGGRIGMVVPSGLVSDCGCAPLRRFLMDRCDVDSLVTFDNSARIFPIHRSFRFLVFTATAGRPSDRLACRAGVREAGTLDGIPDRAGASHFPIVFTRKLLERVSGEEMAVPDARSPEDVALLEKLTSSSPSLGSPEGWNARFGRELNASDDKTLFWPGPAGLPVLEGKHLHPFHVRVPGNVLRLRPGVERLGAAHKAALDRPRLGYRDVACPTNRLTLISAMVPAGSATVHTIFCLKTPLPEDEQWFLCGVLNSFVANFLVRLRVTTHVTAAIVSRLPVPRPPRGSPAAESITALARELGSCPRPEEQREYVRLQVEVSRLYGLSAAELSHVLDTFPLVPPATRDATLRGFLSTRRS